MIKPKFESATSVKILINIGATLDIPTGHFAKGLKGEYILNGGLAFLTGITGIGNNFKSTIAHFMNLSAMNKIMESHESYYNTYDTEINIHEYTLKRFTVRFNSFKDKDILADGIWQITDKVKYPGEKWYEIYKQFSNDKEKDKSLSVDSPFLDRDNKSPVKIIIPSFGLADSFSEFQTSDVMKLQDDNELGESGGNMIHQRQGLAKTRLLMEVPSLTASSYNYLTLTAHMGKENTIASGPYAPPPPKKLQFLKHGDKMKGVTDKFTFNMNNCWHAFNAAPYTNQGTKGPEYPKSVEDNNTPNGDLFTVKLQQLRGKSGPTGIVLEVLVSQSEGVLSELSEFHFIKNADRFGIGGNLQHFHLDLYPEVKLQRTTIRNKLEEDPKLARAVNITCEMAQMLHYWRHLTPNTIPSMSVLYETLKNKGYDWNTLLSTRGYWTLNQYTHPVPFLSSWDLIRMFKDEYTPYWLESDLKTIKKVF